MANSELDHESTHTAPFWTRTTKLPILYFAALLALTLFLSLRDFYSYQFGFTPDSVEYTMLAQALVRGTVFALNYSTTFPEATHYPFGYPLLLTPFVLSAPNAFELPALLSLGATLFSVAILFWGWRDLVPELDPRWRYPVTAMFALAPLTIMHTRLVLSEACFTAFFLLALVAAARLLKEPLRARGWILFGIACFFMVFVRSIGWIVFAAFLIYLGLALRKLFLRGVVWTSATMVLLLGMVLLFTPVKPENLVPQLYLRWFLALGPWRSFNASTSSQPASVAQWSAEYDLDDFFAEHIHTNLRRVLFLTGGGEREAALATQLGTPGLLALPGFLALSFLLIGSAQWVIATRRARQSPISLFLFTACCYLLVVFTWRGGGDRLLHPVQPQLFLAFAFGLLTVVESIGRMFRRVFHRAPPLPVAPTLVGVLVALWLGLAIYRDLTLQTSYTMWGDLRQRSAVLKTYLPPNAQVMSDWAAFDYLHSGVEMMPLPKVESTLELYSALRARNITHLVLASDTAFTKVGNTRRADRVSQAAPYLRELIARGQLTRIYSNTYPLQILRVNP